MERGSAVSNFYRRNNSVEDSSHNSTVNTPDQMIAPMKFRHAFVFLFLLFPYLLRGSEFKDKKVETSIQTNFYL